MKAENKKELIAMKCIQSLEELYIEGPTAVAIGKFDGVHLGHQKILNHLLQAKANGMETVVFTFSPSPAVLFGYGDNRKITTDEERRHILEQIGIDYLIEFPMTLKNAGITAQDFVSEFLKKRMHAKWLVAGPDLSFGYKGEGNIAYLQSIAKDIDLKICEIEKVCMEGTAISSSRIRGLIENGEMETAQKYLGVPYFIAGEVKHGARLGRTIGIPTVNLIPEEDKLLPEFGVYFSKTVVGDKSYQGITNIGKKPTVNQTDAVTVETHIFDFSDDLYGKMIKVELYKFHRQEVKFGSVEELKNAMQCDIVSCKRFFKNF